MSKTIYDFLSEVFKRHGIIIFVLIFFMWLSYISFERLIIHTEQTKTTVDSIHRKTTRLEDKTTKLKEDLTNLNEDVEKLEEIIIYQTIIKNGNQMEVLGWVEKEEKLKEER